MPSATSVSRSCRTSSGARGTVEMPRRLISSATKRGEPVPPAACRICTAQGIPRHPAAAPNPTHRQQQHAPAPPRRGSPRCGPCPWSRRGLHSTTQVAAAADATRTPRHSHHTPPVSSLAGVMPSRMYIFLFFTATVRIVRMSRCFSRRFRMRPRSTGESLDWSFKFRSHMAWALCSVRGDA